MDDLILDEIPAIDIPVAGEPDYGTLVQAVQDLHTSVLDLHLETVNTHNTLMFLIGVICGIAFGYNLLKGWYRA